MHITMITYTHLLIRLFILQLFVVVYGHVDVLQIVQQPETAVAGHVWTDRPLIIKALTKDPTTGKLTLDRTTSITNNNNNNPVPSSIMENSRGDTNPNNGYRSYGPLKIYASVYSKTIIGNNHILLSNQEIVTSSIVNGYANFSTLFMNITGSYTLRVWVDNDYTTMNKPSTDDALSTRTHGLSLGSTESIASTFLSKQRKILSSSSSSSSSVTNPEVLTSAPTVAILTKPIHIIRGPPSRLVITTEPGRATGGIPFISQPIISITDMGGNICTEINSVTAPYGNQTNYTHLYVQVSLYRIPIDVLLAENYDKNTSLLRLEDPSSQSFTQRFVNGTAVFRGLVLNPAADGYILQFQTLYLPSPCNNSNTTIPLNNSFSVYNQTIFSRSFTVGRGPTAKLVIKRQPQGARAGIPFLQQPIIELQDAGGNRNIDDSFSTVSVRIKTNGGIRKRWFEDIVKEYNRTVDNIYDIYLQEQEKLVTKYLGNESFYRSTLFRSGYDFLRSVQPGTLGPRYRRLSYPVNAITGSIQPGSNYIQLSNDPLHLPGGLAPLRNGERIALGGRQGDTNEGNNNRPQTNSQSDGEQSIVYPDYDSPGEIIQFIPPGQRRLKLQHPWHGPSFVDARISKIHPGLIAPVIQGQAIFTDLVIDAIGTGYTLEFTSSLVNISYLCSHGDRKGIPRLDGDRYPHIPIDCTWFGAESDILPFGLGSGVRSSGVGYGKIYHGIPSLTNVSRTVIPNRYLEPSHDRITVTSAPFTVHTGIPQSLKILQPASLAWAGGQPFFQQPVIVIVDSGNNILLNRNDDIIVASIITVDPSDPSRIDRHPLARLLGTRRVRIEEGMAEFTDLSIDIPTWDAPAMVNQLQKLGLQYNRTIHTPLDNMDSRYPSFFSKDPLSLPPQQYTLVYSGHIRGYGYMEIRQTITVAPSAEYMITSFSMNTTNTVATVGNGRSWSMNQNAISTRTGQASGADRVGHSVSMSEDLLAVGAPYADLPRQNVQVIRVIDPAGLHVANQRTVEEQSITLGVEWRPMIQRLSIRGINNTVNTVQGTFGLRLTVPNEPSAESRLLYVTSHEDYIRAAIERDILHPLGYGTAVVANDDDASAGIVSVIRIPEDELDTVTIDKEIMGWYIHFNGIYESIPLLEIVHVQLQSSLTSFAVVPTIDISIHQAVSYLNGTFTLILPHPTSTAATLPFTEHTGTEGYPNASFVPHPLSLTNSILYETRPITIDTDASTLAMILMNDLHVGPVQVSIDDYRTPSTFTGIVGPSGQTSHFYRKWILTFPDRDTSTDGKITNDYLCGNDVPTLFPNATGLQGYGAYASVNVLTEGVSPVKGSFILAFAGVFTPSIPVDATPSVLKAALLATKVIQDVHVSLNSDNDLINDDDEETGYTDGTSTAANEGGPRSRIVRSWLVTFIQTSETIGNGVNNYGDDGDNRILRRDSNYPQNYTRLHWIPFSDAVDNRLRAYPNYTATKDIFGENILNGGTSWVPWNTKVQPGTLLGGHGNVGRTGKVVGRPYVDIIAAYDTDNAPYARNWESSVAGAQRGSYGYQTGRVYLYRRRDRRWLAHTVLQAKDGNEYDLFGYSVSLAVTNTIIGTDSLFSSRSSSSSAVFNISNDGSAQDTIAFIAVGAPGSRQYGDYEVQHLECVASNGTFTLTYANKTTKPIHYTAKANRIAAALHALPVPLHIRVTPLPQQSLSSPVCRSTLYSSNSAVTDDHYGMAITFLYPEEGDIPSLKIDGSSLRGFSDNGIYVPPRTMIIDNVVQGSRISAKNIPRPDTNATGASRGAVYIFEPDYYNPNGIYSSRWYQTAKLKGPLRSEAGTMYGWSVSTTTKGAVNTVQTIAVGAPGDIDDGGIDSGCVYIYNRNPNLPNVYRNDSSWNLHQQLYATTHNSHGGKGYLFGWSVSLSAEGDTLAIGAPGAGQLPYTDNGGRVWIFKRQQVPDALFFIDQVLEPIDTHRNQQIKNVLSGIGVSFGYAVGWGENILAVGAPGSVAIDGTARGEVTGSVYMYDRRGWGNTGQHGGQIVLRQIINPEAAQEGDRVGLSVAAASHTVIMGSVARYEGGQGATAGVQSYGYGLQFGQAMYPPAPQYEVQSISLSLSSFDREQLRHRTNKTIVLTGSFVLQWRRKYVSPVTAQTYHRLRTDEGRNTHPEKARTGWRSITSRRLPWNAPARMLRSALENDLRTGKVRVQRIGPSLETGAYTWLVTFLSPSVDSFAALPLLRIVSLLDIHLLPVTKVNAWIRKSVSTQAAVQHLLRSSSSPSAATDTATLYRLYCTHIDASNNTVSRIITNQELSSSIYTLPACVRLPVPLTRIVRVRTPSLPIRSAAFLYVRNHTVGYGSSWWPAVALSPHIHQNTDTFGYAVTISPSGSFASVGAPSRDNAYHEGTNGLVNGAVFTYALDYLNMAFGGGTIDASLPLSLLRTEYEGTTTLQQQYKDTVSRNHHQGIGLTGTLNIPIKVIRQCTDYVYNHDDVPTNACLAPYVPSLTSRFRLPLGPLLMAYVTVRSGNDWGWHSYYSSRSNSGTSTRGKRTENDIQRLWSPSTDSPIPSGFVAAHAEIHPATGAGCHVSDFMQAYGNSPYVSTMAFRSPYLHSSTDWTRIYPTQGSNGTHTDAYRYCHSSACSLHSLATGECHLLPEHARYDEQGQQDFIPVTRLVAVPLANTGNVTYGWNNPLSTLPSTTILYPILLTDDNVPEPANEILHVSFWLPGMHALPNGPLWTSVQIQDNQDGITKDTFTQSYTNEKIPVPTVKNTLYVQTLVPQSKQLPYGYRWKYGTGIALIDQWMVIGAPYGYPSYTMNKTGIAYLSYRSRTTDEWMTVATLEPGEYILNTMSTVTGTTDIFPRFGTSVSIILDTFYNNQNPSVSKGFIAVSAPGIPCVIVYEFIHNQTETILFTNSTIDPYEITLPGLTVERTAILQPNLYQAYEQQLIETTEDIYSSSAIDVTKDIYARSSDTLFKNTNPEENSTVYRDKEKIPLLYGMDRPLDPFDKCGERHTLAMVTDGGKGIMLLLGCPGIESVFVYRNTPLANTSTEGIGTLNGKDSTLNVTSPKSRDWTITRVLRSSEYAEVRSLGTVYPFPTGFGSAVAASSNTNGITIVIGAPQALAKEKDGKRTSILSESITQHTEQGTGNRDVYPSYHTWTKPTIANLEAYVSAYETGAVTVFEFIGGVTNEDYTGDPRNKGTWEQLTDWRAGDIAIERNRSIHVINDGVGDGVWIQHATLVAPNARAGDRFGSSVDIDGSSLIIGSWGATVRHGNRGPADDVSPTDDTEGKNQATGNDAVTWDFETGDLRGWTATGDAFQFQPVYMDNSIHRPGNYPDPVTGQPSRSIPTGHKGRYWIGTYEANPPDIIDASLETEPAATITNSLRNSGMTGERTTGTRYSHSSPWKVNDVVNGIHNTRKPYLQGRIQGDLPTGSLTSQPFVIAGPTISFFIGGGCNNELVYVELLIDGQWTHYRSTGKCSTVMHKTYWDVRDFRGQMGVIRIVDGSSASPWGHISVDEFLFSWTMEGFPHVSDSGAAYIYRRVALPLSSTQDDTNVENQGQYVRTNSESRGNEPGEFTVRFQEDGVSSTSSQPSYPIPQPRNTVPLRQPCPDEKSSLACIWHLETILRPQDARVGGLFGYSVAIDDSVGIAIVGAPYGKTLIQSIPATDYSSSTTEIGTPVDLDTDTLYQPMYGIGDAISGRGRQTSSVIRSKRTFEKNNPVSSFSVVHNFQQNQQENMDAKLHNEEVVGADQNPFSGLNQLEKNPQTYRTLNREGNVYIYRAVPEKRAGLQELIAPRIWPTSSIHIQLPAPPTKSNQNNLQGSSVVLSKYLTAWGAPEDSFHREFSGSVTLLSLASASFISFSPVDFTLPSSQASASGYPDSTRIGGENSVYTRSTIGQSILNYRIAENNVLHEIVIPVYRHGIKYCPDNSPQSLLKDQTLHIDYATRDISAKSVSMKQGVKCLALPLSERSVCSCGNYIAQTGRLTFYPGMERLDIIVRIMDDLCSPMVTEKNTVGTSMEESISSSPTTAVEDQPGGSSLASYTFAIDLYLPGGKRITGSGTTSTIIVTIDDDDTVLEDELDYNELFSSYQTYADILKGPNENMEKLYRYRQQQYRCQRSCA